MGYLANLVKTAASTAVGVYSALVLGGCDSGPRHPDYHTKKPLKVNGDVVHFEEKNGSNVLHVTRSDTSKVDYIMRPRGELTLDEVCITAVDKSRRCFKDGKIAGEILPKARDQNAQYLKSIYDSNRDRWVNIFEVKKKTAKKEPDASPKKVVEHKKK